MQCQHHTGDWEVTDSAVIVKANDDEYEVIELSCGCTITVENGAAL